MAGGSLEGKVAVVTGGVRGIGRAIVERYASEGASVGVLDVDIRGGELLSAQFAERKESAHFVRCDVGVDTDVQSAMDEVRRTFGSISILVNDAGVNAYFDAAAASEKDWDALMAVDLKGAWLCSKYALPDMVRARDGCIINISSIHAFLTSKGMFPYAAAKSGLVGLTRNLALDYAELNIRVNAICPGFIRTHLVDEWLARQPDPAGAEHKMLEAHPLGRIGSPSDIAAMAWFLASKDACFITGASILVDGGLSVRFAT
jgi:NAD(P)-dependent dehydrogenase (short-subunit alcohol dehydrogenase family)